MDKLRDLVMGSSSHREPNSVEVHIADIEQKLLNWTIPKIGKREVYSSGFKDLFLHDYVIDTVEQFVPVKNGLNQLELLTVDKVKRFYGKYKFLHIGLVQVAIKPLHKMGLDTPIILCLRDARFLSFTDSILAVCESNLTRGPVYFNCYPNFSIDLYDENLSKTLTLEMNVPTSMMTTSSNIVLIYRVYYKLMGSNLSPRALKVSSKDTTLLLEANYDRMNVQIPKMLDWNAVTFPTEWILPQVVVPRPIIPRNQPLVINELEDGSAQLIFRSRSIREATSSKAPTIERHSVSEERPTSSTIRTSTLRGVDWNRNIPLPIYDSVSQRSRIESPPMSPTHSDMAQPNNYQHGI